MSVKLDLKSSNAISCLRTIAILGIVSCHILQALNNKWAIVLNVGVQFFFIMSGFLYGHKDISSWWFWLKKRILKLYIPFIVFVLFIMLCYAFFSGNQISLKNVFCYILNIQYFEGSVMGLQHLWFLSIIFICYFLTPVLQSVKKYSSWVCPLILFIGYLNFYYIHFYEIFFSWFFLYSIGYFYVKANSPIKVLVFIVSCLCFFNFYPFSWNLLLENNYVSLLMHTYGGIFLFFIFFYVIRLFDISRFMPIVRFIDTYSFFMYITHHVFIIGPFSMIYITAHIVLNIILILILIILSAFILRLVSQKLSDSIILLSCPKKTNN